VTRPSGELEYLLLDALEGWDWEIAILGFPIDSDGDDQLGWVGQLGWADDYRSKRAESVDP
jgi:hypothetical protein